MPLYHLAYASNVPNVRLIMVRLFAYDLEFVTKMVISKAEAPLFQAYAIFLKADTLIS